MGKVVPLLQQAIALDSGFAMAWRKLAVSLGNSGASMDQQVMAATRAYQHRDRLPELERELTTAYYFGVADSREDQEEAAYRRVLAIDPQNPIALNNLSLTLAQVGRFAEAESLAAAATADSTNVANTYLQLIMAQAGGGKLDAASRTLDEYKRVAPGSPSYLRGRAVMFALTGPPDSARRALVEMGLQVRDPAYQSLMHNALGLLAQMRGRLAEADKEQQAVITLAEQRGLPGEAVGQASQRARFLALFQHDSAGALRVLQDALARHPLKSMPALDRPYANLATAYAIAGQPAEAKRLLTEFESVVPEGVRRGDSRGYRARGWLALAEGRPMDAVVAFREDANQGAPLRMGALGDRRRL